MASDTSDVARAAYRVRVNTLKALPVLQYLLADRGLEPSMVPFRAGWDVFQQFLKVPADSPEDSAGFQASWVRENPDSPVLEVLLCRQLRDEAAGFRPLRRIVALQFFFERVPTSINEVEIWSSDFPSVDRFLDQVERETAFEHAVGGELTSSDAVLVEEE